ncbi:transposase [Candidatus Enterovibrio escicola]|uniref:Transposase DDE domain-containing protein n=1 Tax=Candidatus Enterovibrio escicola TaxID=1927127 RepID=A0A2A5T5E8_9GAMM|nr:transposase [Candidatus Enterovibrio escacola]PCS23409.1 hypothetical protein BTN49_1006 [Candidatus Enterovibrio escacola]
MVKDIFKFPVSGLKDFLNSVFTLMTVPLTSPTYTCISRPSRTVKIKYHLPNLGAIAHIVIDTTSL